MAPPLKNILQSFIKHVKDLNEKDENDEDGFTKEFQMLRDDALSAKQCNLYPADEGKLEINIKKNRYKDILPYDETRVLLTNEDDTPGSDYINANFVKDAVGNYGYIAAQGPLPHTSDDFWQMIWQYNIEVIVMVCREVEKAKTKCERYWAKKSEEKTFKDITVTLVEVCSINTYYCVRRLRAKKGGEERIITQFHYTGWLDHDIPVDYSDIIDLITNIRETQNDTEIPIVVHCSAGCGRTGTICAVDYAWSKLRIGDMDDDFSLFDIIREMRTQRPSMVQTPEQYRVAHLAVAHFFQEHLKMMLRHDYENVELENSEIKAAGELINLGEEVKPARVMPQSYENHVIMDQVEKDAATCPRTKDQRQVKRAIAMFNSTVPDLPKKPVVAGKPATGDKTAWIGDTKVVKVGGDSPGKEQTLSDGRIDGDVKNIGTESRAKNSTKNGINDRSEKNMGGNKNTPDDTSSRPLNATVDGSSGKSVAAPKVKLKIPPPAGFGKQNSNEEKLPMHPKSAGSAQIVGSQTSNAGVARNKPSSPAVRNNGDDAPLTCDEVKSLKVSKIVSEFNSKVNSGVDSVSTPPQQQGVSPSSNSIKPTSQRSPKLLGTAPAWPPTKNIQSVRLNLNNNNDPQIERSDSSYCSDAAYSSATSYDGYVMQDVAFSGNNSKKLARNEENSHYDEVDVADKDDAASSNENTAASGTDEVVYATVQKKPGKFVIDQSGQTTKNEYNKIDFHESSRKCPTYTDHLLPTDDERGNKYYEISNDSGSSTASLYSTPHDLRLSDTYNVSYSYATNDTALYSEVSSIQPPATREQAAVPKKPEESLHNDQSPKKIKNLSSERLNQVAKADDQSKIGAFSRRFGNRVKNVMNVLPHRRGDQTVDVNLNEKVFFRNQSVSVEQVKQQKPAGPRPIPSTWRQVLM